MAEIAEILRSCAEKYDKARQLSEEECLNDPESEPYKSKYLAKEIFSDIKSDLIKIVDSDRLKVDNNRFDDADNECSQSRRCTKDQLIRIVIAAINYNLGVISIDTEELSTGEEHLMHCLESLKGMELLPEAVLILLRSLNQMGILWSLRGQHEDAKNFLERAEKMCKRYKEQVGTAPYDVSDVLVRLSNDHVGDEAESKLEGNWKTYEKTLTHTLYYLAQVLSSLNETVRAAIYCHTTLRRQLESKEFDPIDWAINSATLSQFFIAQNNFGDARHHLACATRVLDDYEAELSSDGKINENDTQELLESLRHRRADVARCWAKYGLLLLSVSWDNLMRQTVEGIIDGVDQAHVSEESRPAGDTSVVEGSATIESGDHSPELLAAFSHSGITVSDKPHMVFKSLEVTTLEEQVTTKCVLDFDQARPVFLNAQKWLNLAGEYYTLGEHASDHIQVVQDISKLYKVLAYFESSDDRRCKMHKRRIDLMETVLKELNPQYYLNVCRQLQFELAETYSEIMDLKLTILREQVEATPHAVRKVNHLAQKGIDSFQAFLDSFRLTETSEGEMPATFPEELVRPALLAHFCIARLDSKIITDDSDLKMTKLKDSLARYKYIADYCDKHPNAVPVIQEELSVVREMVQLLPVKMDKLLSNAYN